MDLSPWKEKIDSWFEGKLPEMLSLLERIVNMDTFSHDGGDVNKAGEAVCLWLSAHGFQTQKMAKPPLPEDEPWMSSLGNVYRAGTHGLDAAPGVAFIGHLDTVFPAGTAARRPFRVDGAADKATGPGILDMKAGLVVNMFAALALKELGLMPIPMTLTFSCDEELGSPSSTPVLGRILNGAHAVLCTEPGYPGGGVTVERKGSGHMLLEITGKASHAGRNYADGASAILELAHKVLAINSHLDLDNEITVNTGLISGGSSANTVAPWANARIHLTFRRIEDGQKLVNAIRKDVEKTWIPGTSSRISGGIRLYPLTRTAKVDALWKLAENAGKALGTPVCCIRSSGAAESGFCATALKLPALCSLGPEGLGLHSESEFITPSTVLPRAKLVALTALQAAHAFDASPKVSL
ncbi:MAG: M20/M25/M40 family metallo-hydrolase [Mailhella sp.]|nr:M20/M25/M40 family metallo-hydrolase [Mailhella sp.]